MAKDILNLLHLKAVLIEQSTTGVAGEVPVQAVGDARCGTHLTEEPVGIAVAADGREMLHGTIA